MGDCQIKSELLQVITPISLYLIHAYFLAFLRVAQRLRN
jgi:hypothetical protein